MRKMKFYIISLVVLCAMPAFSAGTISGGLYLGYQYDVGNLSEKPLDADLQQNVAAGALLRIDLGILFFRTGADFSYPAEKGHITNSTGGNVTGTEAWFVEVPVYAGIDIPVRDYGMFYMGAGGSYIFGMGSVAASSGSEKINEQLFGWGFIAGIESVINSDVSLFLEWEYMIVSSSPVAASGAGAYDDYYIDYTGSRYRLGVMYHFNRY
ncbi:MAG TPA: outer membrane beta-barrel protein [Spirochaetota bacterium]|nr:outer membrane beta-barrel protein [Spirochaetota bacterium]